MIMGFLVMLNLVCAAANVYFLVDGTGVLKHAVVIPINLFAAWICYKSMGM